MVTTASSTGYQKETQPVVSWLINGVVKPYHERHRKCLNALKRLGTQVEKRGRCLYCIHKVRVNTHFVQGVQVAMGHSR